MALTKRLTVAGLVVFFASILVAPSAQATKVETWGNKWCNVGPTWTGEVGINNDNETVATVTALAVTNGVLLPALAVGTKIGSFANGVGIANGISTSVPSFTVNISVAWTASPNYPAGSANRTITVDRPTGCKADVGTPTTAATPTTTTTTPAATTTTPAVTTTLPGATTQPGATTLPGPTTVPPAATTVVPGATTFVPLPQVPTVLATTVTNVPGATTLPVTGTKPSGRILGFGAIILAIGIGLVTLSLVGRPAARR